MIADINAGFEWYLKGDSLFVNTNTKFFQDTSGDFYTGVYISEDSIFANQNNYDPNIPNGNIYHFHILRDVMSNSSFGEIIAEDNIANGTEIEKGFSIKWNSDWDINNIHINTIVWQKKQQ